MTEWVLAILVSLSGSPRWAEPIAQAATEAPLSGGPLRTAAILLALGHLEGGLGGTARRTDGGQTCTAFQLSVGRSRCDELERDDLAAAREARERVRASLARCWRSPEADRLALYASGRCDRGLRLARGRWNLARYLERRRK